MSRYLFIQPKTIPSQAFINLESFTGLELNRKMVEQDVKVESPQGPGGRNKSKMVKVGTQLVPCPTGQIIVSISTIKRDYTFIYRHEFSRQALTLYNQIISIINSGGSGVATDKVEAKENQTNTQQSQAGEDIQETDTGAQETDTGAATEVEYHAQEEESETNDSEEYEDDPEYVDCVFQCEKCSHIYAYEIADLSMKIGCEECGHENRMACTKADYDEAMEKRRQQAVQTAKKPPARQQQNKPLPKKPAGKKIQLDDDDDDLKSIL